MLRILAYRKLCQIYEITDTWAAFLPTGPYCILEEILKKENMTDEYSCQVELVTESIKKILFIGIPVIGFIELVRYYLWTRKVIHTYLIPAVLPDMGDWSRLIHTIASPLLYYKIWRDL